MSNFSKAFIEVIGLEGGYSNDPDDTGGETKWGISKRAYPSVDIKSLSLEGAREIYFRDYWNPLLLAMVNDDDVACEIFEQGVNFGRTQAVLHLQRALGFIGLPVTVDGWMGQQTLGAVNKAIQTGRKSPLLKALNGFQFVRYLEIVENNPLQGKFFVGWLRRVA